MNKSMVWAGILMLALEIAFIFALSINWSAVTAEMVQYVIAGLVFISLNMTGFYLIVKGASS